MRKAEDMLTNNYFSHTSPAGITPWKWIEDADYDYNYAGENLAMDFTSAEKMNDAWLTSPTHRANILNEKYKDIGVAVKEGVINGRATIVVVQMFGSGDKKAPKDVKNLFQNEGISQTENYIPALPDGKLTEKISFERPQITFPQNGQTLGAKEIEIVGRANPQSTMTIFDNGIFAGNTVADEKGWFKLKVESVPEGDHSLIAQAEYYVANSKVVRISEETKYLIDRQKPSLDYHLYTDESSRGYFIALFSDEKNCSFQLGNKKFWGGSNEKMVLSIEKGQSSIVAAVSDQAGNKTKKQIVLANYFVRENKKSFAESLPLAMFFKAVYAGSSAREALAINLGINGKYK